MSTGDVIGGAVGGLLLIKFDYGVLGIIFGALAVVGASVFYFLAIDTTKT